jgi:hypothetical protein
MSVEIGNFVTFFSLDEEFKHVKQKDIELFVDGLAWYKVEDMGDNWLDVLAHDNIKTIHVGQAYDEYTVFTKESLREHLKALLDNTSHAAICDKIKQLYRKQEFKFQGA